MQDLSTFDPNVEKLTNLVAESAGIVTVDINDALQIETVKKARIRLRDARVLIEKTGKSFREDAVKYQRDVLDKERSLIAIIEPEETRLKAFEEEAKRQKELHLRKQQLPARMERLKTLEFVMTEEAVLAMDSVTFETHVNMLVADKQEAKRKADEKAAKEREEDIKRREDELKAGERKLEEEKKAREREELARTEERERIERQAKEKKELEERQERERKEKEAREKAEVEKKKAYKKFLTDNGWTPEAAQDFKEEHIGEGVVVLWKRVNTFRAK